MSYSLGIDVGTAYTAAALGRATHVEMLPLGDTALVAPSVVFGTREGVLLTGEEAARRADAEPGRAAHEFKRRLGDPTPIVLGDHGYSPAELMAAVVRDVVATARVVTGAEPGSVVLTYPAIWGPYRLEQFTEVPALAGLDQCLVLTEPEAAASFYLSDRPPAPGSLMVVYDLGAGTFDTAVLRATDDRIGLVGNAEGFDGTGGADFDHVVLAMVDESLHGAASRLDRTHPTEAAVLARLRVDAVQAKEALSTEPVVVMPFFFADGPHEVRLDRMEFERRIAPALDRTIEAVWRALNASGAHPSAIDAILLSGGSARIPMVTRRLEEEFGRPVQLFGHPKHVVALGAALLAHPGGDAVTPAVGATAPRPGRRRTVRAATPGRTRIGIRGARVGRNAATIALALAALAAILTGSVWLGVTGSTSMQSPPTTQSPSTTSRPRAAAGAPTTSLTPTPSLSSTPTPSASPSPSVSPSGSSTAPPRQAPPPTAGSTRYKLLNRLSHKVLAVPNRSTAANTVLVQQTDTGDLSQQWLVDAGRDGVRISNALSGLSIAPLNGRATPGTYVAQVNNVGEPAIRWQIVDDGEGWNNIKQSNGLVLALDAQDDADGVRAYLYEYNTTWDHDWQLVRVN